MKPFKAKCVCGCSEAISADSRICAVSSPSGKITGFVSLMIGPPGEQIESQLSRRDAKRLRDWLTRALEEKKS